MSKLSTEAFVLAAIKNLPGVKKLKGGETVAYRGIHTVFTGFNTAFREYFEGLDPVKVTTEMAKAGTIVSIPSKGGAMLYLPENAPANRVPAEVRGKEALAKIIAG